MLLIIFDPVQMANESMPEGGGPEDKVYCKSGNFGQCNIFGKRKNTPFSKKKISVLRTLDY